MKIFLFIITLLLSLSSCKWFTEAKLPQLAFTNIEIPPGTPNFQKGYKDGCSTALYARGYGPYRMRYKYALDASLIDDSEYIFGRKRGYNYCFVYIAGASGHFSGGWDSYLYGQGTPFNMGKGNLNDTQIGGNVFDSWGDMAGGVSGSLDVLQSNRINGTSKTSVFGGPMFWGKTAEQNSQILGW